MSRSDVRPIPFLDLVTPHLELEEELVGAVRSAFRTAAFIGGAAVEGFEREFAALCGASHCVGVSSGTDALRFAVMAAGVEPGDAVVTVPNTFIATTEAIAQAGGQPEFVDVDPRTCTMDPASLRAHLATACSRDPQTGRAVSRRTGRPVTAVVPVHLYGHMADMDPLLALAREYNFAVVEDACQAHGAEYFSRADARWHKAGSMGRTAAFSFYPGKNLGACGEAGAVTTNDEQAARVCRMLRDHGQSKKYFHDIDGYNGRLDAIQAAILRTKLGRLEEWNRKRREAASRYTDLFATATDEVAAPFEAGWAKSVYHLYVIRSPYRDQIQSALAEAGIGTLIHYPVPLHLQLANRRLGYAAGDFPVSEAASAEILSLPMYPHLALEQQQRVVDQVARAIHTHVPASRRPSDLRAATA